MPIITCLNDFKDVVNDCFCVELEPTANASTQILKDSYIYLPHGICQRTKLRLDHNMEGTHITGPCYPLL